MREKEAGRQRGGYHAGKKREKTPRRGTTSREEEMKKGGEIAAASAPGSQVAGRDETPEQPPFLRCWMWPELRSPYSCDIRGEWERGGRPVADIAPRLPAPPQCVRTWPRRSSPAHSTDSVVRRRRGSEAPRQPKQSGWRAPNKANEEREGNTEGDKKRGKARREAKKWQ